MYSIGKFAKEIGVTTQTLRNWHDSGELMPFKITNVGTRHYNKRQLKEFKDEELTSDD